MTDYEFIEETHNSLHREIVALKVAVAGIQTQLDDLRAWKREHERAHWESREVVGFDE